VVGWGIIKMMVRCVIPTSFYVMFFQLHFIGTSKFPSIHGSK
jgi:hypothetical protein